jgi:hypothetical protein
LSAHELYDALAMARKGGVALATIVLAGVCAAPSLAAVSFFRSPSGNISCEVASKAERNALQRF